MADIPARMHLANLALSDLSDAALKVDRLWEEAVANRESLVSDTLDDTFPESVFPSWDEVARVLLNWHLDFDEKVRELGQS